MHLLWPLGCEFYLDPPLLFRRTLLSQEHKWSQYAAYEAVWKEANENDTNGNGDFDHNLSVLVQHSEVGINCFDELSQNTSHNI